MESIVQTRFVNDYFNTEENIKGVKELYSSIIAKAIEFGIWDESIKAIVVTDDFTNEVEKQAVVWNIKTYLSKEKEYSVASKVLFNHKLESPEYHIFFHFQNFYNDSFPHIQIVIGQILNVLANKIIPNEIRQYKLKYQPSTLEEFIKVASTDWCKAVYSRDYLSKLLITPIPPMNHNSFLIAFKRKLKRYLYDHNSDKFDKQQRLDNFWHSYFESLNILFLRVVENANCESALKIKDDEPSKELIYNVVYEIGELTKKCLEQEQYDVTPLEESIKKFSAHFEVFLEDESDHKFRITLTKDPKDYFIDEIVETEPRIICFMDILGFSELINEYDTDITSTVLQDIQESFALAKTQLLENKNLGNKEALRHMKYQTFSDNICISIPYFDNEHDFLTNFNLLSVYVRGFQLIMMSKAIFMRGGISTGSYYADNNIIFSKGLVNAYHLESKKAIYPRVIIDNSIMEKIFSYREEKVKSFGLDTSIILDWENVAFLNPFGLGNSSVKQLESVFNSLNFEEDEPLSKLMSSFTKTIGDMTIGLLKNVSSQEKAGLVSIKDKIIENIYRHQKNENIVSKYLWLLEFIKWFESDETGKLKFQFLTERINKQENK
ncbi:MAG: hypothetical protein K9G41_12790 [Flavobacteriales bacterium]|nr:hypothetical protein [Flavobacteriales bacterium]